MKALTYSLCCGLLLTSNVHSPAQAPDPTQDAIRESLIRQTAKIDLRQKLADAQAAQRKGDNFLAARLYDEALALATRAVTGVDQEYRQVLVGMTQVRLILADQAQRRLEFDQAENHARIVLKEDPKNEAVLAFVAQNARLRGEMEGRMPSQDAIARLPEAHQDHVRAGTLVQDGKL